MWMCTWQVVDQPFLRLLAVAKGKGASRDHDRHVQPLCFEWTAVAGPHKFRDHDWAFRQSLASDCFWQRFPNVPACCALHNSDYCVARRLVFNPPSVQVSQWPPLKPRQRGFVDNNARHAWCNTRHRRQGDRSAEAVADNHNRLVVRFAFNERHEVYDMIFEYGHCLDARTPIPAPVVYQPRRTCKSPRDGKKCCSPVHHAVNEENSGGIWPIETAYVKAVADLPLHVVTALR